MQNLPDEPKAEGVILVVDDDEAILELLRATLDHSGYSVHTAPNGEQALAFAARLHQRIDLLISDFQMPGANGVELHEELCRRYGYIPVLVVSGIPDAIQASYPSLPFLQKPFRMAALLARVRSILAERTAAAAEVSVWVALNRLWEAPTPPPRPPVAQPVLPLPVSLK